jgi:hypothetical protein
MLAPVTPCFQEWASNAVEGSLKEAAPWWRPPSLDTLDHGEAMEGGRGPRRGAGSQTAQAVLVRAGYALGKAEVEARRIALSCVSSPQQVFCSFDGTALLIRAPLSTVQAYDTGADGAISKASNFEPGRPLDIARRPFQLSPVGGSICRECPEVWPLTERFRLPSIELPPTAVIRRGPTTLLPLTFARSGDASILERLKFLFRYVALMRHTAGRTAGSSPIPCKAFEFEGSRHRLKPRRHLSRS